ncbi:dehydrogenase/reductase SDR family member 7B-like [Conger conger]|uniref:dehydrogenase/reductase SDR family member 7B-like n=1 Tax=Conger conger TaxID=82655 RepID=UPI002A5AB03C|nr:dehydrogenase/reductase SDR family member 7B-like [Conger conger]
MQLSCNSTPVTFHGFSSAKPGSFLVPGPFNNMDLAQLKYKITSIVGVTCTFVLLSGFPINSWDYQSVIPFALGGAGVLLLYQLPQRVRQRAYIQDAVVVITGASSGLGKECARVFHAAGARLILCGRDHARLQQLLQELGEAADGKWKMYSPSTMTFDLSDTATVASAAEEILKCHDHMDILINNAGISYHRTVLTTHVDVHKEVMSINYVGPITLTQAILPSMVQRRSGHVVVISSVQGKIAIPFRSAYAASKHTTQADATQDATQDKTTAEGRDPREVAEAVLRAVGGRKADVLLAGLLPTLAVNIRTLCPALFFRLMASRAQKERRPKED